MTARAPTPDPVLAAFDAAPVEDEEPTEEELAQLAENAKHATTIPGDVVTAEIAKRAPRP